MNADLETLRKHLYFNVGHIRFGYSNKGAVDVDAWANLVYQQRLTLTEAINLIRGGYPKPPDWVVNPPNVDPLGEERV